MVEKYLYQYVGLHLKGRKKNIIYGIIVDYNEEWVLIKRNVIEYMIDGYELINRSKIAQVFKDDHLKFKEDIFKAKYIDFTYTPFDLSEDFFTILKQINQKYGAFSLRLKHSNDWRIGRFLEKDGECVFAIEELSETGEWLDTIDELSVDEVYGIGFDCDYVQSLLLFANKKMGIR
ncbi:MULTISPECIES: hypothetical protein [Myroides]|uniref:Uncharacterized protein n=1 Tax=Myroides albus TaxID=2562892 RepID=A0A6I3LPD4_9FLAO|nr:MULTISPECIES: hypothetical protein [Myroides]MTG99286.1 hypothetical protein [Myroides albus]MVX36712.1 hypothetical protein [Myroides sp. LoEW2-1]UVD79830.1 hypothetical protein NWE55_00610 [Myroides albus]